MDLKQCIEESFVQYSGAVLQSRALVDVRDCLKPSARQIFYCLQTDKFIHNKPFNKTMKALGSAMRLYIHGDLSCIGVLMRAGQPFNMRYPLIEIEGSYGNLMKSGNWAAPRYTGSRLSKLSSYLFKDIDKDTIDDWRDNYDDTEQYPSVLPSKGFYNIVNPTMGIGIGAACSIPGFNIKEVNNALITLLWNPDATFEELYCAPDLPTGATILNESEVKESLKKGKGKSCKIRSTIEYDKKNKCLVVTEIPLGVYTNTICRELEEIINDDTKNPGIKRFNDLTGKYPNIKIYLENNANVSKVLRYLYKNTSLQYYYGINLTMLDEGRFPKVFTWKEALQAHIDHEIKIYTKGYEYDLRKIKNRLHIIEGILIALNNIEEVIALIKSSSTTKEANLNLQKEYSLTEIQAAAILKITLSKLAHLEIEKFENEKKELEENFQKIQKILESETLLKKEIEKGLREVAEKFGDDRRTKVLDLEEEDDEEPVEIINLSVSLTNKNNLIVEKSSTLYTQGRRGVGKKFDLEDDEYIISTISGQNDGKILLFTDNGIFYNIKMAQLQDGKNPIEMLCDIKSYEKPKEITYLVRNNEKDIIFFTKNGLIKRSKMSEYNVNRQTGIKALSLDKDDSVVNVLFMNEGVVGMLSKNGNFMTTKVDDISPIGRVSKGVIGMKLNSGDELVSTHIIPQETKSFITITEKGLVKQTINKNFYPSSRNTKGKRIQKLEENDYNVDFMPVVDEKTVTIIATSSQLKTNISDIPILGTQAKGNKSIKIKEEDKIVSLKKEVKND